MRVLLTVVLLFITHFGCTDKDVCGKGMEESNNYCVFPDTNQTDNLAITIRVPDDFAPSPALLQVNFFDADEENGRPVGFGEQISNPDLKPGELFEFTSSQGGLEGEIIVTIVIYFPGGGAGKGPAAGVDWVSSRELVTLGPNTGVVETGEMSLVLFEEENNDK